MADKYFITQDDKKLDLTTAIAKDNDSLALDIVSSFGPANGYFGENFNYIDPEKLKNIPILAKCWGTETFTTPMYKYKGNPLHFCIKESAPYPIAQDFVVGLPFKYKKAVLKDNPIIVWYDNTDGYIKYSDDLNERTNATELFKADGIFVALQGAGGGGAGSCGTWGWIFAGYQGAGGGGGGGFALVYINLKKYNEAIIIKTGSGGKNGAGSLDGSQGNPGDYGGSTEITTTPNIHGYCRRIVSAGGGGGGGWDNGQCVYGGSGGNVVMYTGYQEFITLLFDMNGGKGGNAAPASGIAFWVATGHEDAEYGRLCGDYAYDDPISAGQKGYATCHINTFILKDTPYVWRELSGYLCGRGPQPGGNWGDNSFSEGGGGGGAVCSYRYKNDTACGGNGAGGSGGWSDYNGPHEGQLGQDGVAFILDQIIPN